MNSPAAKSVPVAPACARPAQGYWPMLLLAGLVFFLYNYFTTLKGDDVRFLYLYDETTHQLRDVASWRGFLSTLAYHYQNTNGRLSDVLAHFFCAVAGKGVFNVVNSLVIIAFIDGMARWTGRRTAPMAALLIAFVLALLPYPGETLLWMCGACGYMWTVAASLLLWHHVLTWQGRASGWHLLGVGLAALLAGAMGEIVSLPTTAAVVVCMALNRRWRSPLVVVALLGYVGGLAVILASPALWARAGSEMHAQGLWHRCVALARRCCHFVTPALGLVAVAVSCVRQGVRRTLGRADVWLLLMSVGLVLVVGDFKKDRMFFVVSIAGMIVTARLVAHLLEHSHVLTLVLASVLTLVNLGLAVHYYEQIRDYHSAFVSMERTIQASPQLCVLRSEPYEARRWVAVDRLDSQSYSSYDLLYRVYYGKRQIVFLRPSLFKRYQQRNLLQGGTIAPMASDKPLVARAIYNFAGQDYALVPIAVGSVDPAALFLQVSLTPGHNRLTTGKPTWFHGITREKSQVNFFTLIHNGGTYLVIPPAESDVARVVIPILDAQGRHTTLTFTRQSQQPL